MQAYSFPCGFSFFSMWWFLCRLPCFFPILLLASLLLLHVSSFCLLSVVPISIFLQCLFLFLDTLEMSTVRKTLFVLELLLTSSPYPRWSVPRWLVPFGMLHLTCGLCALLSLRHPPPVAAGDASTEGRNTRHAPSYATLLRYAPRFGPLATSAWLPSGRPC